MMARSAAYTDFRSALTLAEELISIDARLLRDPPKPQEVGAAVALRGGASVLMVAAFEAYLTDFLREFVDRLRTGTPPVLSARLPVELQVANVFNTLKRALDGPRYGPKGERKDRLPAIRSASLTIAQDLLNPEAFAESTGNPKAAAVRSALGAVGIRDVFALGLTRFQRKWGSPVAKRFPADKLDEIVERRHRVAHRAEALGVSRQDLRQAERFLRLFAEVIDIEGLAHLRAIGRAAS